MESIDSLLLGNTKGILHLRATIAQVAASSASVLVRGETGTGKELVAQAIHLTSSRALLPMVKVHCAALPETLLESELFGFEAGAFTGAAKRHVGRVERAAGGTLFLDEVGEIPVPMQAKLLRLLQDREYERLGSSDVRRTDARFVAATHRDLERMVAEGSFREDLMYRLNVVTLWVPPLRARRDDIPLLASRFCEHHAAKQGKALSISAEALSALRVKRWPGNVRELNNLVERVVTLASRGELGPRDFDAADERVEFKTETVPQRDGVSAATPASEVPGSLRLDDRLREAEKRALLAALEHAGGNRSAAAKLLGISRGTLYTKLAEHGLL
ncbi:MAG: sigma-54 interaction domain-containing protein [Polyangiaceae bacterium]